MTTKMAPTKVLEAQADLLRRFQDEEFMIYTARFFYQTATKERLSGVLLPIKEREKLRIAADLAHDTSINVRNAEAFHVSADMTKVIQHAAEGLDESDVTNAALAPAPSGLVRFDGGLRIVVGTTETWVDWILWRASAAGVTYLLIMDAADRPDEGEATARAASVSQKVFGRWRWTQIVSRPNGLSLGPAFQPEYVSQGDLRDPVSFGETSREVPVTNTARLLHAFWLMIDQQITVVSTQRPHPSVKPGLKKARMPKDSKVTVVELRKHRYAKRPDEAEGSPVEWSHRWLVRGFWRWQAHGEGWKERKRIWINDFVKGPDDKPLVVKNQVFDLRR
jgi:hypothetical protein